MYHSTLLGSRRSNLVGMEVRSPPINAAYDLSLHILRLRLALPPRSKH